MLHPCSMAKKIGFLTPSGYYLSEPPQARAITENARMEQKPLPVSRPGSYLKFLRNNPVWRRFWAAGVISHLGNWFNYIAIFVLISSEGGGGRAVGWFLIAKFIPSTIFGPAAGVIVDRFDRKRIMVAADLVRAVIVLGFLLADRPERRWLIYALALLQETVWTFYDPARRASVPNICRPEELNLANAMSGATWSVMLALGAAAGGIVTAWLGWRAAILIDSATFLASAAMVAGLPIPSPKVDTAGRSPGSLLGLNDLRECLAYLKREREIAALLLVKSGWALSGGILVLLTWFGEHIFPAIGPGGGSGILYSFRGLGAAIGPILAWSLFGEGKENMRRAIAASFFISSAAYLGFSAAPSLRLAVWFVFAGHIGGSIQWVFSTNLLQRSVEDRYRGRIFAGEMALLTLVLSISTFFTGAALDSTISPRITAAALALTFLLPGMLWVFFLKRIKIRG